MPAFSSAACGLTQNNHLFSRMTSHQGPWRQEGKRGVDYKGHTLRAARVRHACFRKAAALNRTRFPPPCLVLEPASYFSRRINSSVILILSRKEEYFAPWACFLPCTFSRPRAARVQPSVPSPFYLLAFNFCPRLPALFFFFLNRFPGVLGNFSDGCRERA